MHPVVEANGLGRRYGRVDALRDATFSIRRGEIVGLLGENGAGKSTTMRILCAFIAPTSGEARVCGYDVLGQPRAVAQHVGYLPESAPLYGEMTVREWLSYLGRVHGLGPSERARRIEVVSEECGVSDRLGERIDTLSRGLKQRVGLAGVLLHEPPLLVLDEPTAGLDPNQIVEIRDLIRTLGQRRTVLISTHILSEAEVTCDRVLVLHRGILVADQSVEELKRSAASTLTRVGIGKGKVDLATSALERELSELPGVSHVVTETPGAGEQFRFALRSDTDVRPEVFEWAVRRGQILLEMTCPTKSLEDVFRALTHEGP